MILPDNYTVNKISDIQADIEFTLTDSLYYLNGHFKAQPILPGVVQLGWAIYFAKDLFGISTSNNMPQVKFTLPIVPKDEVTLTININREKNNFSFEYFVKNVQKKASSGKVKINE